MEEGKIYARCTRAVYNSEGLSHALALLYRAGATAGTYRCGPGAAAPARGHPAPLPTRMLALLLLRALCDPHSGGWCHHLLACTQICPPRRLLTGVRQHSASRRPPPSLAVIPAVRGRPQQRSTPRGRRGALRALSGARLSSSVPALPPGGSPHCRPQPRVNCWRNSVSISFKNSSLT